MLYCPQCRIQIRGVKERCVLCGNTLSMLDPDKGKEEVFPVISPAYERHLAIRILVFISFAAVVASFAIRMIFPTDVNWPLFVVFGLVSMWLSLVVIVRKSHNIPKTIMWQVTVVTLLSILWDWQTGWRGWSINYLMPIIYVSAELVMYITARIMKLSIRDYITYAMLDGLFGILPVIFILFGWVQVLYPSVICIAVSVIFLAGIFIFQGEDIKNEWNKRMHI
ncbi:hypothetical protein SAMN02745823_02385 [Sporobacter termitidis DSM 10068]|uniref:Zinc ribbon domain-containing protein n=2 Tax=Sporobacter TaxID=44748 RepID=A0A1M5YCQ7_9FIRM|nr:hypothetical protein SAMN02745823_02385 [Sporobacter termitidis DSM 10068]